MPLALREHICRARKLPRNDELLMARAELLLPEDRDLIEAVFVHRQSAVTLGRMLGVNPRRIRRRVHLLARRMASRRFMDAARALPYLDERDAGIARMAFCQHLSQRDIAKRTGLKRHEVRRKLDRLSVRISMIRRLSRPEELIAGRYATK
jgi:DNA-directed RNA polymerase specialized sigma24 family protein